MAAKPKMTPEEWVKVRTTWEADPREGYSWLVTELNLPVSRPAISKVAVREGWKKAKVTQKSETINDKPIEKPSKAKRVKSRSKKPSPDTVKVTQDDSETMRETISETLEEVSKREPGRPTLFREEYIKQAYRLSLLGTTDEEVAIYFDVSEQTIKNWMKEHPDFLASIQRGKLHSDGKVARATYKSALGKHYVESDQLKGEGEVVTLRRQIPPDVAAQRMWLFNRRPKQWRNKIELKEEINLNTFPPKEVLDDIYNRAREVAAKRLEEVKARRERLSHIIDNDTGEVID